MRATPRRGMRARRSGSPSSAPSSRAAAGARLAVPLVASDELIGLLVAEGSARVELAPRRRKPGRGRDQEDPGDRAADGEEPDQGLLRGAGRRAAARRSRRAGGPARLRPGAAARRARRRAADEALERALRPCSPGLALRPPRGFAPGARCGSHATPRPSSSGFARSTASSSDRSRSASRASAKGRSVRRRLRGGTAGAPGHGRAPRRAGRSRVRGARRVQVSPPGRGRRRRPRRDRGRGREASPSTTRSAARSSSRRSRSSSAGTAASARRPRRSSSTRTRCASGCAGSASSRASTFGGTTG